MGFSLGIIGLPNVGKSTIFNALSRAGAEVSNYPFCTKDKNEGVVPVPDPRLEKVRELMGSPKAYPTTIEFVDIAGLVKGASRGEGLGNQFLSYIREVDAIAHVVRCFPDTNIAHVDGSVDPKRDIETVQTELILADLATVEKRMNSLEGRIKAADKEAVKEMKALKEIKEHLDAGRPAPGFDLPLDLLSAKPVLYVANIDESSLPGPDEYDVAICGKLEAELADLPPEEASAFMKEVGLKEPGLSKLIRAGYELLDLITFFTSNEKETRAWTVKKGAKAPGAAGKVHSDMEKGFISAEIIHFNDLVSSGSHSRARDAGVARTEGKNYEMSDGDIAYFRFNV